jgi:surfactin synthase thioesterase subunit
VGLDLQFNLLPLQSPELKDVGDAYVHAGFLEAYNSVALEVLHVIQTQLTLRPSYNIIVTGHSLGGAIASLGAISIRSTHSYVPMRLFTFGMCFPGANVQLIIDQQDRSAPNRESFICWICRTTDWSYQHLPRCVTVVRFPAYSENFDSAVHTWG